VRTNYGNRQLSPAEKRNAGKCGLTAREIEVLELVLSGESNRQIGAALGMTESTAKGHCSTLFRLLKVANRALLISRVHAGLLRSSRQ
jgi:DNA-binding CsgD family transcriptional regulator